MRGGGREEGSGGGWVELVEEGARRRITGQGMREQCGGRRRVGEKVHHEWMRGGAHGVCGGERRRAAGHARAPAGGGCAGMSLPQ